MNEFSITFARSARQELEALEATVVGRVFPRIEALAANPRPRGCCKLRGEKNRWRLRVGDYRVVYAIDTAKRVVDIIAVEHRRDVYR